MIAHRMIKGLKREMCLVKGIKLQGTVDSSRNAGMPTVLGAAFCKLIKQRWATFAGCLVSNEKRIERY